MNWHTLLLEEAEHHQREADGWIDHPYATKEWIDQCIKMHTEKATMLREIAAEFGPKGDRIT